MGLTLEYIDGQTPLDEEEKEGLLIPAIATRGELDEYEQQNIEQSIQWSMGKLFKPEVIFTEAFIRNLHKRMYGNVWDWAGISGKPIRTWVLTSGKYPLNLTIYWMMPGIGMKTKLTRPMKLR